MKAPKRYKPRADWTIQEVLANDRDGTVPESEEYKAYLARVHEAAGLDPPPDLKGEPKPADEWSPEDHLQAIKSRWVGR